MTAEAEKLPTELTIRYLVDLTPSDDKDVNLQGVLGPTVDINSQESLIEYLQANGVVVKGDDDKDATPTTLEECRVAVREMLRPSFWPKHASLHPNYGRVKNWLLVHSRYRDQAKAILENDDEVFFQKFHTKIEKHSEFEETQLFKYFADQQRQKRHLQDNLTKLDHQHDGFHLVQSIRRSMANKEGAWEEWVRPHLETFVNDLMDHFQLEEETLVGPWLQLTPQEYKTYRSYLSWKYCFMY